MAWHQWWSHGAVKSWERTNHYPPGRWHTRKFPPEHEHVLAKVEVVHFSNIEIVICVSINFIGDLCTDYITRNLGATSQFTITIIWFLNYICKFFIIYTHKIICNRLTYNQLCLNNRLSLIGKKYTSIIGTVN